MQDLIPFLSLGEGVHFNSNILETNMCDQFIGEIRKY
jgi:hypothetical protein